MAETEPVVVTADNYDAVMKRIEDMLAGDPPADTSAGQDLLSLVAAVQKFEREMAAQKGEAQQCDCPKCRRARKARSGEPLTFWEARSMVLRGSLFTTFGILIQLLVLPFVLMGVVAACLGAIRPASVFLFVGRRCGKAAMEAISGLAEFSGCQPGEEDDDDGPAERVVVVNRMVDEDGNVVAQQTAVFGPEKE